MIGSAQPTVRRLTSKLMTIAIAPTKNIEWVIIACAIGEVRILYHPITDGKNTADDEQKIQHSEGRAAGELFRHR